MRSAKLAIVPALVGALALGACGGESSREAESGGEVGAVPAGAPSYATLDRDGDGTVMEAEFTTAVRDRVFRRWDTTADSGLDRNELAAGVFDTWDANDDGRLDAGEWRNGTGRWQQEPGLDYGGLDPAGNDDRWLNRADADARLDRAGLFDRWDADASGRVDENEFGRGVLGMYDTNRDMRVDADEWRLGAGGVDWF